MSQPFRAEFVFHGDLSSSQVSDPVLMPPGSTALNIDIGYPNGDTLGALTIEESIHGDPLGGWGAYSLDGTTTLTTAVNGALAALADRSIRFRDIMIAGQRHIRLRYARTSGGVGAHFNDCSTDATKAPVATFAS
jgi:hypothetical protein